MSLAGRQSCRATTRPKDQASGLVNRIAASCLTFRFVEC
jgi:hypothetical protein